MPFYEYRCSACGHELEVLQKMSDKLLVDCPSCGEATLSKLMSAAGFQLKGSGWYVTDFKDGNKGKKDKDDSKPKDEATKSESGAPGKSDSDAARKGDKSGDSPAASTKGDGKSSETSGTGSKSGASSDSTGK